MFLFCFTVRWLNAWQQEGPATIETNELGHTCIFSLDARRLPAIATLRKTLL